MSPRVRPPPIMVPSTAGAAPAGRWQPLSPRSAEQLLGPGNGSNVDAGNFAETFTPGGSPRFSSRRRRDSRRTVLLNLAYLNLFLALVLVILGAAGPQYPGHSGTTDNAFTDGNHRRLTVQDSPLYLADCPTGEVDRANASILHSALIVGLVIWLTQPCSTHYIYDQVDKRGAAATLLTSVVSAFTCLGAFTVVNLDIDYIASCCALMEDNCEVSNLCTQFVDDCCISDDVEEYCSNASYHVGAVSMIFLVFVSTSAMMIMACTMTCRCWMDADPEKQAMMMVLTGTAMTSSRPDSPKFSPRLALLSGTGAGDGMKSPGRRSPAVTAAAAAARWGGAGGLAGDAEDGHRRVAAVAAGSPSTASISRQKCSQCGAVFGDATTLANHVERFHPKGRSSNTGASVETEGGRSGPARRALTRKGSIYTPDEGPLVGAYGGHPS